MSDQNKTEISENATGKAVALSKLLGCPFCGGVAIEEDERGSFGGYGFKRVYCQDCSASAGKSHWQKRTNRAT